MTNPVVVSKVIDYYIDAGVAWQMLVDAMTRCPAVYVRIEYDRITVGDSSWCGDRGCQLMADDLREAAIAVLREPSA